MRAIVPNRDYFKPINLKFKTFIYKRKIIYNCCNYGGITPLIVGEVTSLGEKFFTVVNFLKERLKIRKING